MDSVYVKGLWRRNGVRMKKEEEREASCSYFMSLSPFNRALEGAEKGKKLCEIVVLDARLLVNDSRGVSSRN